MATTNNTLQNSSSLENSVVDRLGALELSKNNRISVDSEFSFESDPKMKAEQREMVNGLNGLRIASNVTNSSLGLNIGDITLDDITNLQFKSHVPDKLKLSFIKSLLIKLVTLDKDVKSNKSSYKALLEDLDDDLNSRLNAIMTWKKDVDPNATFPTLDPAVSALSTKSQTNSQQSLKQDTEFSSSSKDILKNATSPYIHSNASSEYQKDELASVGSAYSSHYGSRNQSVQDLTEATTISSRKPLPLDTKASSLYSPKNTKLPNSPSATYSHNRIQLPSPRNETTVNNISSITESANVTHAKTMSPISLMNDDAEDFDNETMSKQDELNPFTTKAHESPSSIYDQQRNKSSGSLFATPSNENNSDTKPDTERPKRNPNRIAKANEAQKKPSASSSSTQSQQQQQQHQANGTTSIRNVSGNSNSAKSSPALGKNTPLVRNSPVMYASDSERTTKMYGMGIMGLDSPAIVRRDASPSSPGSSNGVNYKKSNSPIINGSSGRFQVNAMSNRDRFYQATSGKKPSYTAFTSSTGGSERKHVKSPTISTLPSFHTSRSQPSTPQSPSFSDLDENNLDGDATLFIQPKDLHTVSLKIITSLSINKSNSSSFDPTIIFGAIDKVSQKEIWRFKKSYSQLVKFDSDLRGLFESFLLPPLPDKSIFLNNIPMKIDIRRAGLLDYFTALLNIPKLPKKAVYQICKFISSSTVNPLDDIEYNFSNEINEKLMKKQGYLVRRNKGLGSNWKVRYCKCEGPFLNVFDSVEGSLVEVIKLNGAQIGRQNTPVDVNSDDNASNAKGYRHAFLLKEIKKNSIGSGSNKHVFCAETDEERDSWIDILIQYVQEPETENQPVDLQPMLGQGINNGGISSMMDSGSSAGGSGMTNSVSTSILSGTPSLGHNRTRSADTTPNSHSFADVTSPSINGARFDHYDEDGQHPTKKSKMRFLGGIINRNKANVSSPSDFESSASNDDFQMNAVTDLSSYTTDDLNTSIMTSGNVTMGSSAGTPNTSLAQSSTVNTFRQFSADDTDLSINSERLFGAPLAKAVQLSSYEQNGHKVPSIIHRCLDYLTQTGAGYHEGIFRLSGSSTVIKQLKERFDAKYDIDLTESEMRPEINSVTGLLKLYLRELPENILTSEINTRLLSNLTEYSNDYAKSSPQLSRLKIDDQNKPAYLTYMYQTRSLINQLPAVNKAVLYVLIKFLLKEVIANTEFNKMNLRNIVIVFSATLSIESKVLMEFFINFKFLFENGEMVNETDRPVVESISIPLA